MLSEGGFSPEDVVFLTNVLEEVWIKCQARDVPHAKDPSAARARLASIIIGLAPLAASDDAERFKARVMHRFEQGV
jgi:hypothetical protein